MCRCIKGSSLLNRTLLGEGYHCHQTSSMKIMSILQTSSIKIKYIFQISELEEIMLGGSREMNVSDIQHVRQSAIIDC